MDDETVDENWPVGILVSFGPALVLCIKLLFTLPSLFGIKNYYELFSGPWADHND